MYSSYEIIERFYGLDGDKIGGIIDAHFIRNNIEALSTFSENVTFAVESIKDSVAQGGGSVIFCAGDSVLFRGKFDDLWCENLLMLFLAQTGCTASMGVGRSASDAYLALKLAKADGGGRVIRYS